MTTNKTSYWHVSYRAHENSYEDCLDGDGKRMAETWLREDTWYEKGAELVPADESSELFRKMKAEINKRDKRCRRGFSLAHHDLLAAVIFKEPPARELTDRMAKAGYRIVELPRNPKPLAP